MLFQSGRLWASAREGRADCCSVIQHAFPTLHWDVAKLLSNSPCLVFRSHPFSCYDILSQFPLLLCWAEQSIKRSQRWALQSPCTQTPSLQWGKRLCFRGTWLPWGRCFIVASRAAAPPSQYRLRCSCQTYTTAAMHFLVRKGGAQRSYIPLPASHRSRQEELSEFRYQSVQFHSSTLPHFLYTVLLDALTFATDWRGELASYGTAYSTCIAYLFFSFGDYLYKKKKSLPGTFLIVKKSSKCK